MGDTAKKLEEATAKVEGFAAEYEAKQDEIKKVKVDAEKAHEDAIKALDGEKVKVQSEYETKVAELKATFGGDETSKEYKAQKEALDDKKTKDDKALDARIEAENEAWTKLEAKLTEEETKKLQNLKFEYEVDEPENEHISIRTKLNNAKTKAEEDNQKAETLKGEIEVAKTTKENAFKAKEEARIAEIQTIALLAKAELAEKNNLAKIADLKVKLKKIMDESEAKNIKVDEEKLTPELAEIIKELEGKTSAELSKELQDQKQEQKEAEEKVEQTEKDLAEAGVDKPNTPENPETPQTKDETKKETPKETTKEKPVVKSSNNPNTGDAGIILALVSFIAAGGASVILKRNKQN